jgi:hypothetical protein
LNINTKETEKLSKYKDLDQGQQDVKSEKKIVPVRIGALGTIKKRLDRTFCCF